MNNLEMEAVKRVASLPYDWSRFNNKVLLIAQIISETQLRLFHSHEEEECPMIIWRIWRSMSAIR